MHNVTVKEGFVVPSSCTMDLKINCLLCREPVTNFPNTGLHIPWIEEMTMSICQILHLDPTLQPLLELAVYCKSCLFTLRDLSFILKSINSLQRRLEDSRLRVITLLGNNFDELGVGEISDRDEVEVSYEQLIKSIWESLSADKKPFYAESCGNESELVLNAKSRISHRRKIEARARQPLGMLSHSDSDYHPEDDAPHNEVDIDSYETQPLEIRKRISVAPSQKINSPKRRKIQLSQETSELKKSSKINRNAASFRCGCGAAFTSRLSLKQHRRDICPLIHPETIKTDGDIAFEENEENGFDKRNLRKRSVAKTRVLKSKRSRQKFKCQECSFTSESKTRFQVHGRIHGGDETPYHCDMCKEAKFAIQGALYDHKRRSCPANTDIGNRKNTIKRQLKTETGRRSRFRLESETDESESGDKDPLEDKKEYTCAYEDCNFSTKSEKRFQCHRRVHEGDPLPYWCSSCSMKFPKAKHLNLHKHRNCGPVLPCPISNCDSVFPNKWTVKVHLDTSHYNYEKHTCQLCSKTFEAGQEEHYQTHVEAHEMRVSVLRKFSCVVDNCSSNFTNSIDLKAHVLQEHEASSSKCDICQALLANPISLKRHMVQLHGPPKVYLQCEQCPYFAKSKAGLALHMNRHSQTFGYICDVNGCGKGFNWPSGLRTHKLSHTGIRKYKCSFENCTKGFVTRGKLRDHEETHNSRHSYFCDRCTKTFKAKKNLEQHIRYMHNVDDDDGHGHMKKTKQEREDDGEGVTKKNSRLKKVKTKKTSEKPNQTTPEASRPDTVNNDNADAATVTLPSQIIIAEDARGTPVDVTLGTSTWTLTQQYVGIGIGSGQQFLNPLIHPENNTTLYFND